MISIAIDLLLGSFEWLTREMPPKKSSRTLTLPPSFYFKIYNAEMWSQLDQFDLE